MALDVPEPESADGRSDGLRQTKVRILQEREAEFVILTDGHEGASGIESLKDPIQSSERVWRKKYLRLPRGKRRKDTQKYMGGVHKS